MEDEGTGCAIVLGVAGVATAIYLVYEYMSQIALVLLFTAIAGALIFGFIKLIANSGNIFHYFHKKSAIEQIQATKTTKGLNAEQPELESLMSELKYYLTYNPITSNGIAKQTQEVESTIKKIEAITKQMNVIKTAGITLSDLSAEQKVSETTLNYMVSEKLKDLQRIVEEKEITHTNKMYNLSLDKDRADMSVRAMWLENDKRAAKNERIRAENDKTSAESEKIRAEADGNLRLADAQARKIISDIDVERLMVEVEVRYKETKTLYEAEKIGFIKDILSKIDIREVPSDLQAYIIANVFNENQKSYDDFSWQERLKVYTERYEEMRAEQEKQKAERMKKDVENAGLDNDFKKSKFEREKEKMKKGQNNN